MAYKNLPSSGEQVLKVVKARFTVPDNDSGPFSSGVFLPEGAFVTRVWGKVISYNSSVSVLPYMYRLHTDKQFDPLGIAGSKDLLATSLLQMMYNPSTGASLNAPNVYTDADAGLSVTGNHPGANPNGPEEIQLSLTGSFDVGGHVFDFYVEYFEAEEFPA